jgi:hypothetical protein
VKVLLAVLLCVAVAYTAIVVISLSRVPPTDQHPSGATFSGLNLHPAGVVYEDPRPMLLK